MHGSTKIDQTKTELSWSRWERKARRKTFEEQSDAKIEEEVIFSRKRMKWLSGEYETGSPPVFQKQVGWETWTT